MSRLPKALAGHITSVLVQRNAWCNRTIFICGFINISAASIQIHRCFNLVLQPILYENPACQQMSRDCRYRLDRFVWAMGNCISGTPLLDRHPLHIFEFWSDSMIITLRNNKVLSNRTLAYRPYCRREVGILGKDFSTVLYEWNWPHQSLFLLLNLSMQGLKAE